MNTANIQREGVGKQTERSYFYREEQTPIRKPNMLIDTAVIKGDVVSVPGPLRSFPAVNDPPGPWYHLRGRFVPYQKTAKMPANLNLGDGTVPLISTGYMCAKGLALPQFHLTRLYRH